MGEVDGLNRPKGPPGIDRPWAWGDLRKALGGKVVSVVSSARLYESGIFCVA